MASNSEMAPGLQWRSATKTLGSVIDPGWPITSEGELYLPVEVQKLIETASSVRIELL